MYAEYIQVEFWDRRIMRISGETDRKGKYAKIDGIVFVEEVIGRSAVMELLELKGSGASKLLSNLVQADIIEPVSGHGKGKYKFKK